MRVIRRDEIFQHARAAGGAPAVGTENIFLGKGNTRQRLRLPGGNAGIGGTGLRQTAFGVDANVSVKRGIERIHAR